MSVTVSEKNFNILNMELLVNTVQQLSLAQDIESIMRIVRTVARKLTGADGATFVLKDGDNCYYADEDAISPLWKGSRFPMKACISGWAMLHKKPVMIEDIYADERIPADAYRPTFVKSLAMVPIRTIDPIGAIGNYWAHHRTPTKEEMASLQALADITAVSIENVYVRNTLEEKVVERTQELADSLEREKRLNKVKSAFLSMASHEFRTPLTTILSSVAIAEQYTEASQQDKREKHFVRIKSAVNNLLDILTNFLSVDKIEQGKIEATGEVFDLREFLQDIIEELEGMKKTGQSVQFIYKGRETVLLDKKILRNVILNLLSNAIKYSDKNIRLEAEVVKKHIKITVEDKGIGIPEAQQKKLFSKFFRATNALDIQGTGLGLNIVKHYIDLLEGIILFESHEGVGTKFTVRIPEHSG